MDPQQFADQIAETERRFRERTDERASTKDALATGGMLTADTPERVAKRLERLEVEPMVIEAIVARRVGAPDVVAAEAAAPIDERSALVLERLIGDNDLIGVGFLEAGYLAGHAVGRIEVPLAGGRSYGTGSLVSPRLLLTNNHVLKTAAQAAAARVQFNYQLGLDGAPLLPVAFALEPAAFFLTDKHLDFTLVAVAERAGSRELAEFGWNQLIEAEGKVILGEAVNIIQHPSGEPKQLALRENQLIDLLDDFVHYETDTAPGSSGSPVFNDQWELIALHHSGVPKTDDQDRILALNGAVWQRSMGEGQVDWIANEGARVSRIVRYLNAERLTGEQRRFRAAVFDAAPPRPPHETARGQAGTTDQPGAPGTAVWTVPIEIRINVGTPSTGQAALTVVAPTDTGVAVAVGTPAVAAADAPELATALEELARSKRRTYFSEARDRPAREAYYQGLDDGLDAQERYEQLSRLVTETHARQPAYKPSTLVYPWVDLHPDHQLRSIYSGKTFAPELFIREDFAAERARSEALRELFVTESVGEEVLAAEIDALEAAYPYNCEHVVPQSWFQKREPMRGDLHHLFACEWGCNSFRGNTPYFDFADFEEALRDDCGKREGDRFEPASGKGAAARAVLYFLLRYPAVVSAIEFPHERVAILLDWHGGDGVERYERHRNQAIFELQGNRNPLIDHPDWARQIAFDRGIG